MFERLTLVFIEELRKSISELTEAVNNKQIDEMGEIAHLLKSSSGNIGSIAFSDLCKKIELQIKTGQIDLLTKSIQSFDIEYKRLVDVLKLECPQLDLTDIKLVNQPTLSDLKGKERKPGLVIVADDNRTTRI